MWSEHDFLGASMQCRIGIVLVLLMSGCSGEGAESAAADTETSTPMTDGGAAASDGTVDGMSGPEPCVPDEGAWADARATLEQYCGFCHGETPAYGAPYTLLNYDSLVAGDIGARPIDRAVERIRIGDMPPVGQPEIPAQEALAFLDWATCGENTDEPEPGPNPGGFDVSRPVFVSPDMPPAESTFVEFVRTMVTYRQMSVTNTPAFHSQGPTVETATFGGRAHHRRCKSASSYRAL